MGAPSSLPVGLNVSSMSTHTRISWVSGEGSSLHRGIINYVTVTISIKTVPAQVCAVNFVVKGKIQKKGVPQASYFW